MSIFTIIPEILFFAGASVSPFYLNWRRSRMTAKLNLSSFDRSAEMLSLQAIHGYSEHSLVGIGGEKKFWFDDAGMGAIAYTEHGSVRLVTGEPLAAKENLEAIAVAFMQTARREGKIVAFLPVTERFASLFEGKNLDIIRVGASPYFDLQKWNPRGNKAKHLRASLNQARKNGLEVQEVLEISGKFRREVEELGEKWLATRQAGVKFGWLFDLEPFQNAECKKFFEARDAENKLVGVLVASPIPARDGWYLEDVLREPDAPKGTAEILVAETMRILAAQGAKIATLGTVPLAEKGSELTEGNNLLTKKCLQIARKNLNLIYNFDGLKCFKSKFVPCWWESEYVLAQKGFCVAPRVAKAFFHVLLPDGLLSLLRRKPSK